jgi:hypothetical protein
MTAKCLDNPTGKSIDVIIITAPLTDSHLPMMAPAALKPIVEKAGHTCLAVDLNVEVYNDLLQHVAVTGQNLNDYMRFFFDDHANNKEVQSYLWNLLYDTAQRVVSWNPKYLGISVFSYANRAFTKWLCYVVKKLSPDIKIILGGAGCLEQFTGPALFADELLNNRLADFHIRGDGEHALYELLTGNNSYDGINDNQWKQLSNEDLSRLPIPDYSDYFFDAYRKRSLCIQGSRGCVRACKFCDYIANWTKFSWRTADDIFAEMKAQYDKHGIRSFKFQDTLTNGNVKEFNRLIEMLADYNTTNPDHSFTWGGYYIFREQTKTDDYLWQKLHESGASVLIVGIESLDQEIRYEIGKKFSNESIDHHLENALKYNIGLQLLFITGYVNETYQHIEDRKKWLDTHVKYQPIIKGIQWGGGLGIFPNTYLDKNKKELNIVMVGTTPHEWINSVTGSTPKMRAQWVRELNEYSESLGYVVAQNIDNHFLLEQLINETA